MTTDAGVPGAPRFDVVLRGYDRRQVDEHVDRLQRVLSRMRADLDVARSQPMPAVNPSQPARPRPTPRPRPGGPAGNPDTIGNFTDRMESILQSAEEEAAEIRRNAHLAARAETDGIRSQVADLIRQRDSVLAELTRMRSQLEGLLAAPTAQMPAHESGRSGGARPDPDRPDPYGRPDSGPWPSEGPRADPARRSASSTGPQSPVGPGPSGAQHPGGPGPGAPAPVGSKPAGSTVSGPGQAGSTASGSGQAGSGRSASGAAAPGSSPTQSGKVSSDQGPSGQGPSAPGSSSQNPSSQNPAPQKASPQSSSGQSSSGPKASGPKASGPKASGPNASGPNASSPPVAPPKPASGGAQSGAPKPVPPVSSSPSSALSGPPASGPAASNPSGPSRASDPASALHGGPTGGAASGSRPSGPGSSPVPPGSTTILPTGLTPPDRRTAGTGAGSSSTTTGSTGAGSKDAPPTRPEREAGKAAHRLPTGAYPAVAENSSMRPRSEPDPEPADLFRPVPRGGSADPQTTAVPRGGGEPAVDRTSVVRRDDLPERAATPPAVESTTKVGSVRPEEPTVLSPQPGPARADHGDGRNGSSRPTSPSRSA